MNAIRLIGVLLLSSGSLVGNPTVVAARCLGGFKFAGIAAPAINDAGAKARLELVDGRRDTNGANLPVLIDGRVPGGEDQPGANFFFAPGTDGGRLRLDLAAPTEVGGIANYSWHRSSRAPQVYSIWGSSGEADGFLPAPKRITSPKLIVKTFTSEDEKFQYTVDVTKIPEFMPWVEGELMPAVETWYPKMAAMMPSKGYTAPNTVHIEFKDDMGGTPAYASGNRVSLSIPFFQNELKRKDQGEAKGEAKGCVIHELVHVIQNFGLARRINRNPSRTPGWITEGLADYVRWFRFEPEKQGARITRRNIGSARHDASYRVSANFIDWVVREHDEHLLRKLNAAAREGRYKEELWKDWTGKRLDELATLWLDSHRKRLGIGN